MINGTLTRTFLAGAVVAALTGCITIEETRPASTSGTATTSGTTTGGERQYANEILNFEFTAATDVDTAYNRLRREFGYLTLDERAPPHSSQRPWIEADDSFHHRAHPGSSYSMRDYREILGHAGVVQMDVTRDGSGSHIAVEYYEGTDSVDGFPVSDEFMNRFRAKVRSTVE